MASSSGNPPRPEGASLGSSPRPPGPPQMAVPGPPGPPSTGPRPVGAPVRANVAEAPPTISQYFRLVEGTTGMAVEVEEGDGNSFHLGPILRKYTAARMAVKGAKRTTTVELGLLYDALGLLRSLQYDVAQFNAAAGSTGRSGEEQAQGRVMEGAAVRYACYRLTRQASAFGVRIPRAGTSPVSVPGLDDLITYIEGEYKDEIGRARGHIAGGVVDFPALAEFFLPGTDLLDRGAATGLFGVPTAMRVRAAYFSRGKSLFGVVSTFYAALEYVVSVGDKYAVVECHFPIAEYQGTKSTTEGLENFIVLSEGMKCELTSRGTMYAALTSSNAYVEYSSGSFLPVSKAGTGRAAGRAKGGGRIMIDSHAAWVRGVHCARSEGAASEAVKGVLKLVANKSKAAAVQQSSTQYTAGSGGQTASTEEESLELLLLPSPLPSNLLWLTWPVVAGFSFPAKSWGVVMVSGLKDVTFNEDAFRRLVMPEGRKKLIEALVTSHTDTSAFKRGNGVSGAGASLSPSPARSAVHTDIMAGKGEGSIFLLYGPPGVGKTLTAEAIAEMLHKPLYVVSMGELGTTPETLEERLLDIIDLCTPWGALVLIDEAEMLLERRSKNDIVRNAMVCVMLRLLEYYSGILFLTTNRVESLDPAFQSRVQCALRYQALDASSREKIWRDMLGHAQADVSADIDIPGLASHDLNGRQIKNALQLALALCRQEGVPLAQRHLDATLDITTAFISETADGRL